MRLTSETTPEPDEPFTPIRTRARHDGWTAERQRDFLAALAMLGLVGAAAREVGMSARSAYRLRARDRTGAFADAWDDALEQGRDRACALAIERAVHGVAVPVYYRGRKIGERIRYNDALVVQAMRLVLEKRRALDESPRPYGADKRFGRRVAADRG